MGDSVDVEGDLVALRLLGADIVNDVQWLDLVGDE